MLGYQQYLANLKRKNGFPDSSVGKESNCNAGDSGTIPGSRDRLPTPVFLCFPCGLAGKGSACKAGDLALIPWSGRSPGEGKGYPLQYSGLENSMDCIVHGVAKSQKQLGDFHCLSFMSPKSKMVTPAQTSPLSCRLFSCLPNIFTYNCKFNMNFCFFLLKEPAFPVSSHS